MTSAEVFKKIKRIQLKTRKQSSQLFSGAYQSAFKGRGMSFSEVREYVPGDDVRSIDWNVTARFNAPYVKIFEEDRELNVVLLIDVSWSTLFGSQFQRKADLIIEIAALLAFAALQNNDKCTLLAYSDKLESYIPPVKGMHNIPRFVNTLIQLKSSHSKTNLAFAFKDCIKRISRKSLIFILSDFKSSGYNKQLKVLAHKHEVMVLDVFDPLELQLPELGILPLQNPETGAYMWVDTSSAAFKLHFKQQTDRFYSVKHSTFKESGIRALPINTNSSYILPLIQFLKSA